MTRPANPEFRRRATRLVWALDKQASGIYLAVLQAEDASGHRASRKIKIALAR